MSDDQPTATELAIIAAPLIANGYGRDAALQAAYGLWLAARRFLVALDELPDNERETKVRSFET